MILACNVSSAFPCLGDDCLLPSLGVVFTYFQCFILNPRKLNRFLPHNYTGVVFKRVLGLQFKPMSFNPLEDYFSASLDNSYVFMHIKVIGISDQAKATAIVVLIYL